MITVEVYRLADGNPIKGARVMLGFGGAWSGTHSKTELTNSNGQVHFNHDGGRTGEIFVDGKSVKKGTISGKEIVYV